MTIERSIPLVVGSVVLISVLLAVYQNLNRLWLTGLDGRAPDPGLLHGPVPGRAAPEAHGPAVAAGLRLSAGRRDAPGAPAAGKFNMALPQRKFRKR